MKPQTHTDDGETARNAIGLKKKNAKDDLRVESSNLSKPPSKSLKPKRPKPMGEVHHTDPPRSELPKGSLSLILNLKPQLKKFSLQ